jgi:hypothetical protein
MNKKGSIAFALLLVIVFLILGVALLVRSMNENLAATRMANATSALWVAEAGLQQLLYEYNVNNCTNMVQASTPSVHCASCTSCGGDSKILSGTLNGYGDYDITLNNAGTSVQSIGSVPDRSATNRISRTVQSTIGRPAIFGNGIFAKGQVTISNNALVDSYNSSNGLYGGQNVNHNGNVGSNGTTAGVVTINNNGDVYGNVATGPGGTVVQGNGSTVSGTITDNANVSLPSVEVPDSLTSLSSSGALTLGNNGTATINGGDYRYTNLSFANNAVLTINGDVRLYLTGNEALTSQNNVVLNVTSGSSLTIYADGIVDLKNNITINNVAKNPAKFLIYSTYSSNTTGVQLSNNGQSFVGVYAPNTGVNISNNNGLFGAVVGKTVVLDNNAEVHYDEALNTMANPYEESVITNWQEV